MPCEEYSSLKELLMDGQLEVVRALAGLRHVDRVPLAAALLKVFRSVVRWPASDTWTGCRWPPPSSRSSGQ